jgi:hypothetical protein
MYCDKQAFDYAKRERKQYTYRCHLGLYESVFPIITEKNLIGYLMIGQFIEENDHTKIERDFTFGNGISRMPCKDIRQGRFTCSIRPHDGMHLAWMDSQVEAFEYLFASNSGM